MMPAQSKMLTQAHTAREEYRVSAPPASLVQNLDFGCFLAGAPKSNRGEGVFARYLTRPDGSGCLQVLAYYRRQLVPYHENDFAPVFVFTDPQQQPTVLCYDSGHHRASLLTMESERPRLTIIGPWHAFSIRTPSWLVRSFVPEVRFLDDDRIRQWWSLTGAPQLKLRQALVDPWAMLDEVEGQTTFRDVSYCPACGSSFLHDDMTVSASFFQKEVVCSRQHKYVAKLNVDDWRMTTVVLQE